MAEAIEKQIARLRAELHHHNDLYYNKARPQISDQEYDRLMRELIELEKAHPDLLTPDSPSQRVGGAPASEFITVEHAVPMMSIDNTYDEAEVRAFDARVRKGLGEEPQYVLEPKIDGVSMNLRYEQGLLVLGATRGDGRRGDDVTTNVKTIKSIPLRLPAHENVPDVLEVRGEVYMLNSDFQKLNADREAAGEEIYKNPRNLTTGACASLTRASPRRASCASLRTDSARSSR